MRIPKQFLAAMIVAAFVPLASHGWSAPTLNSNTVRTLSNTADINIPGVDNDDVNGFAVNVNGVVPGDSLSVRGLLFQADGVSGTGATIAGPGGETIQVTSQNNINNWATTPALTGTDSGNLNAILHNIRWQDVGNLRTTLSNLEVGRTYRLQMLSHENTAAVRAWDIIFDVGGLNTLIQDDFTSGVFGAGNILELEFTPDSPILLIDYIANSKNTPGGDNNPILQAVVLSAFAVPEPTTIAIWSLLGMAMAGYGLYRRRKT